MTLQNREVSIILFYFKCRHKIEPDLSIIYTELEKLFEKDHLPNDLHEWSELSKNKSDLNIDPIFKFGEFKPTHAKQFYALCRYILQIGTSDISKELEQIFGSVNEIDLSNLKNRPRNDSNDQRIDDPYFQNSHPTKTLKVEIASLKRPSSSNDSLEEQLKAAKDKVYQLQDKLAAMYLQIEIQQDNKIYKSKFSSDIQNKRSPNASKQSTDAISVHLMQTNEKAKPFEIELRNLQDLVAKLKFENTYLNEENSNLKRLNGSKKKMNSYLNAKLIEMNISSKKGEDTQSSLLNSVIEKHQTELANFQLQLNQRHEELLISENKLNESMKNLDQASQEIEKLKNENKLLKDTIDRHQSQVQTLNVKFENPNEEITLLKKERDKVVGYYKNYVKEMEKFQENLIKEKEKYELLELKEKKTSEENHSIRTFCNSAKEEFNEMKLKLEKLIGENDLLKIENKKLKSCNQPIEPEPDFFDISLQRLTKTFETNKSILEKELADSKAINQELKIKLETRLADISSELTLNETNVKNLNSNIQKLETENKNLKLLWKASEENSTKKYEKEIEELKESKKEINLKLSELLELQPKQEDDLKQLREKLEAKELELEEAKRNWEIEFRDLNDKYTLSNHDLAEVNSKLEQNTNLVQKLEHLIELYTGEQEKKFLIKKENEEPINASSQCISDLHTILSSNNEKLRENKKYIDNLKSEKETLKREADNQKKIIDDLLKKNTQSIRNNAELTFEKNKLEEKLNECLRKKLSSDNKENESDQDSDDIIVLDETEFNEFSFKQSKRKLGLKEECAYDSDEKNNISKHAKA